MPAKSYLSIFEIMKVEEQLRSEKKGLSVDFRQN